MPDKYNQFKAMFAIAKASLKATFRSPSSVAFGFGFPLIIILVFGFVGNNGTFSLDVGLEKDADTLSPAYAMLKQIPGLHFIDKPDTILNEDLSKGNITALIDIRKNTKDTLTKYYIHLKTSNAVNQQNVRTLQNVLTAALMPPDQNVPRLIRVDANVEKTPGRVYRNIDFYLPGQLGFSLLGAGVFGVAFLFFNLRQQLVLKRFFATPIKRPYIVFGEALSRVTFQMITSVIIIGIGVVFFNFTLVHGFATFLQMMILSFLGLLVFMGFGFIVSSVAKNESTIPPFANIFTFPQLLLSGTFFPVDVFPKWLQFLCNLLPLTHFNNAMRDISFEGASILSSWKDVGGLLIWGVIVYAVAIKLFKWD
jgi:ABC-2 type transport system permease protein